MRKEPEKTETPNTQKGSTSVFLYVLILFSAALLLMGLSSLLHQRSNTEALGKLQSSVSVMREVQNLQEKIIDLQEIRETLEEGLEQARREKSEEEARTDAERKRVEALERLYVIQILYREERYQACQGKIDAFEADGLPGYLSAEEPENGVLSPLDFYRQLQEATAARIAEPPSNTD